MVRIRRPGHATVAAYLALVVALGTGGAWAAGKITAKDIAKNAVRTKHVRDRAVTAKKLAHGGTLYGRAPASAELKLLLSWRPMRLQVRTAADGDPSYQVRIRNTNAPGGPSFWVGEGGTLENIEPGSSEAVGSLVGVDVRIVENGGAGRMVLLHCFANVIVLGDDGFMQCMAITAGRR